MNKKDVQLIAEAYTNKLLKEHHKEDWPRSVLNMPVSKLLDVLKDEEIVEGELYQDLEDFIKLHWKADFEANQEPGFPEDESAISNPLDRNNWD